MTPPSIPDYTFRALIGEGSTGRVYAAEYGGQTLMALKAFNSDNINRQLISDALVKIFNREEHPGVVAVHDFDLASTQTYMATSLHGEPYQAADGVESFRPRTIQGLIGHLMAEDSWGYARQIADALAFLHRQRVIHCNLHPSNVLLDGSTPPHIKLTDFSQGLVGAVPKLVPGDAVFYAAPEQIRQPEHYFGGRAERWDVYAFGVLTFQLLTGQYPRLGNAITEIKNREAASPDSKFNYDYRVLADLIEDQEEYEWPEPAADDDEAARRAIIDRCLELKPEDRFPDMREVVIAFQALEDEQARQEEHRKIASEQMRADKQAASLKKICAALGVLALGGLAGSAYFSQKPGKTPDPIVIEEKKEDPAPPVVPPGPTVSEQELAEMKTLLDNSTEHLRESQAALDEIFALVISRDSEGNSEYDLPEDSRGLLLNYYEDFASQNLANPQLAFEVVRANSNAAEIHLSLGDSEAALAHLETAKTKLDGLLVRDPDDVQLIITAARLQGTLSEAQTLAGLSRAAAESATESQRQWEALHQKNPTSSGASRALADSLITLGQRMLEIARPADTGLAVQRAKTILKELESAGEFTEHDQVALSRCDFLLGLSERDKGNYDDAIELLIEAVDQLLNVKIANPDPPRQQLYSLATYYGELADTLALNGNRDESDTANTEATNLLLDLVDQVPGSIGYHFELSRRFTRKAAILRDAGKGKEARAEQEKALAITDDLLKVHPKRYDIRLENALQQGDMMDLQADAGSKEGIIDSGTKAISALNALLNEDFDAEDNNAKRGRYRLAYGDVLVRFGQHAEKVFKDNTNALQYYQKGVKQLQQAVDAGSGGEEDKAIISTAEARIKALGG